MSTPALALPNSIQSIETRLPAGQIRLGQVVAMLFSRLTLFGLFQGLIALAALALGAAHPWEAAAAWWPLAATLTNVSVAGLLAWRVRQEGLRLVDLYRPGAHQVWRELLICLGLLVIGGPLGVLPNLALGQLLFKDPTELSRLFFQPLPLWAGYLLLVVFPLTNGLVELPTYFAYGMPRLAALTRRSWLAVLFPALMLSLQHLTLPLRLDGRFLVWRGLMFLPFALFVGIVLRWRPRLLPYFMVVHALMDAQLMTMILAASR